jgi:hypothetical protein
MELSSVEIKILGEALVKVTGESDYSDMSGDASQNPINNLVASSIPVEHACEVAEVQDAIENSGLTMLERSALDASLNASHGWKKAFSDQHINPKTGKSYSRAAVAIILERAHQKVKTYLKVA